eukprot:4962746-Pyramimonas_sp.AAC.1
MLSGPMREVAPPRFSTSVLGPLSGGAQISRLGAGPAEVGPLPLVGDPPPAPVAEVTQTLSLP